MCQGGTYSYTSNRFVKQLSDRNSYYYQIFQLIVYSTGFGTIIVRIISLLHDLEDFTVFNLR